MTVPVTILMPCRNAHVGFLTEAVDSVFGQTSPRWELVVIDDASDDPATLEALGELAAAGEPRVRVVESRGRMVTGALNTGMACANSRFVCVLHCDDLLDRRAVDVLARAIASDPGVDYFHSSRRFVDASGSPLSSVYRAEESFHLGDFEQGCPVKSLHCWRVGAAFSIGGMDESLGLHAADDYDFPWRMAEAGFAFKAIPDCLYYIRDHREHYRLTTHVPLDVQLAELATVLRKHGLGEQTVNEQIARRRGAHLRQALYTSAEDKLRKDRDGFDIRGGWRADYL